MPDIVQVLEEPQTEEERDAWAEESNLVTSTFKMPAENLRRLEELLPELIEFMNLMEVKTSSRDETIGHLIMFGVNEIRKTKHKMEIQSRAQVIIEKLLPEIEKEFGIESNPEVSEI